MRIAGDLPLWRYGRLSEAKRPNALEEKNAKQEKLLAEQMLDAGLSELLSNVWFAPCVQRA